jgi:hypothetical protein
MDVDVLASNKNSRFPDVAVDWGPFADPSLAVAEPTW